MEIDFQPDTRVVAAKDQVSCDLGDEAVVLHSVRGVYYGLNPVAATVWRALKQPRSLGELRDIVLQEYEVEPERCVEDVVAVLKEMAGAGLVERAGRMEDDGRVCREHEGGDLEQLHFELAYQAFKRNNAAEAREMAAAALQKFPRSVPLRFVARLAIPIVYRDEDEIAHYRKRFCDGLAEIEQELRLDAAEERQSARDALRRWSNFYLAYQGENDRDLQARYGQMVQRIMQASYPQWMQPKPARRKCGRVRVGYLSAFFRAHSVANLTLGWLRGCDRAQFEIFAYYTGQTRDHRTAELEKLSDHFRYQTGANACDAEFESLCRQILQDELDILVYSDVAMWPTAAMMGALRLAPVQCVGWAHPVTSGLPNMDYFLSGDLMEPADAQQHYREKLVRLPNLGVAYEHPGASGEPVTRAQFGIPEDAVVYLCCQALYKYLPQHDHVYAEIARQAPNARFVFLLFGLPAANELFQQRLQRAFAQAGLDSGCFCIFLPAQPYLRYRSLMSVCDVFLDTMGWSGGNTAYEAAASGLPMVTKPGQFLRGRHCYAILRMLGLPELIAADEQEYVRIAVRLGVEREYREQARARLLANQNRLFDDWSSVKTLEEFYRQAIAQRAAAG